MFGIPGVQHLPFLKGILSGQYLYTFLCICTYFQLAILCFQAKSRETGGAFELCQEGSSRLLFLSVWNLEYNESIATVACTKVLVQIQRERAPPGHPPAPRFVAFRGQAFCSLSSVLLTATLCPLSATAPSFLVGFCVPGRNLFQPRNKDHTLGENMYFSCAHEEVFVL